MGRKPKDLTGLKVGRLTVLKRSEKKSKDGHVLWDCICECGNYTTVASNSLTRKNNPTMSCGCLQLETLYQYSIKNYTDLTNRRFGKLVAKEMLGTYQGKDSAKLWRCECDCGNKNFITTSHHLISGNTKSCGCLKMSVGEYNINTILINNNIKFE